MKTVHTLSKLLAVVAVFVLVLSFASCDIFGGSLKLESFTVDRSTIKTNYIVGEEIDFTGIKATAKYSDASLNKVYTYDELTIDYEDGITDTVGKKKVTVSFLDPNLNVEQKAEVEITVTEDGDEITTPQIVVQFENPTNLTAFNSANESAGSLSYGQPGFEGQFAVGDKTYVIGNENAFKLSPLFAILDENGVPAERSSFYTDVMISIEKDGEYVELTSVEGENNSLSFYDGETLIVTVDAFKGEYSFSAAAENCKVKISVLPSADYYLNASDFNAIVFEAEIIKAYNIYEAWQLAVIDNANSKWNDFKTSKGIANVSVTGIVLHADIKITADDVPADFFYTSDKEVVYTNSETGETKTMPEGTKFLIDGTIVYSRIGTSDLRIEGNFFALDTREFPLVASPAVFGADAKKDYGSDFSNAALIRVATIPIYYDYATSTYYPCGEDVAVVDINNIQFIGNAARDNFVDATEKLASAGGLIFFKSSHYTKTSIDNLIGNSGFITYFIDYDASLDATNVKCFDSYQNAVFAWGKCEVNFTDSYIYGCGGPVIIAQSKLDIAGQHPVVNIDNTITETHVVGNEIWFKAVGADVLVNTIKALSQGLQAGMGVGSFVDADGKMNIIGTVMASGNDPTTVITGINAQGSIAVDDTTFSRFQDNVNWLTIKGITEYALAQPNASPSTIPAFFTVTGADGNLYSIYYNGSTFVDLNGVALGTSAEHVASHMAIMAAFKSADIITLTQGGLSVVFEFYHN